MNRNRQSGFTLLEAVLSLALGLLVVGAFLTALRPMQQWSADLGSLASREGAVWTIPSLLAGWIVPAGNDRHRQGRPGVWVANDVLALQSDLEGEGGFPDGDLDEPFEFLRLRAQAGQLQVRSGRGFYQPAAQAVAALRIQRPTEQWLRLELEAALPRPLLGPGTREGEPLILDFALPNFRPNLFAEVEE
ncbi:MAG TPA: prepilin-type N-terminal cleavage/methylation domain-containing protein [Acidobacteriota bacterium]|nr:prepilin-type N-terminal cleavage/methylation domain-containing protein [Acidobacteriota bacterium]